MVQFRWIQVSSFLVLLPHFTGAEIYSFGVKIGNNAVMHCRNGIDHRGRCDDVRWVLHRRLPEGEQELSRGRIIMRPEDKSYRLSITEECSLVVREVTFDDAGYYMCEKSRTYPQPIINLTVFTRGTAGRNETATEQACTDCSVVDYIMLVLRVAELVLITVITVLLIRAPGNQRPPDDDTVPHDGGRHEGAANYENIGGPSASVNTSVN